MLSNWFYQQYGQWATSQPPFSITETLGKNVKLLFLGCLSDLNVSISFAGLSKCRCQGLKRILTVLAEITFENTDDFVKIRFANKVNKHKTMLRSDWFGNFNSTENLKRTTLQCYL